MEFADAFGQVLKKHRKQMRLSQEEIAHRAGMHHTAISLYERGLRQPTLFTVFTLSKVLQVSACSLVAEVEALNPMLR